MGSWNDHGQGTKKVFVNHPAKTTSLLQEHVETLDRLTRLELTYTNGCKNLMYVLSTVRFHSCSRLTFPIAVFKLPFVRLRPLCSIETDGTLTWSGPRSLSHGSVDLQMSNRLAVAGAPERTTVPAKYLYSWDFLGPSIYHSTIHVTGHPNAWTTCSKVIMWIDMYAFHLISQSQDNDSNITQVNDLLLIMIPLGVSIAISALFILLYVARKWALPKPLPGIPFRLGSERSILGDAAGMLSDLADSDQTWMQWVSWQMIKLDSPIIQILLPFRKPIVVVGDYNEARDISMRRCPGEFDRSSMLTELLSGALGDCHIMFRTDDRFKAHRRLIMDLVSPLFLRDVAAPNIYTHALRLIELWDVKARIAAGRPFDAEPDVFGAALDATFGFAFGADFPHSAMQPKLAAVKNMSLPSGETGCEDVDEPCLFPMAPVDDVVAATLELTAAVEKVQGSLSMKFSWWWMSLGRRFKWASSIRDEYILAVLRDAVKRHVEGKQGHHVRCAVDCMIQREIQLVEKTGKQPEFCSFAMRGEVSLSPSNLGIHAVRPLCILGEEC